jgi:hypothetical protein
MELGVNSSSASPYKTTRVVMCPYCRKPAALVDSVIVFRKSHGPIWFCAGCRAWTGVHQNSPDYAPKGSLAKEELRKLRSDAHHAFDLLWSSGRMTRDEAYGLMCSLMHVSGPRAHIGFFSEEQCTDLIRKLDNAGALGCPN